MEPSLGYLLGKLGLELDRAADQILQEQIGLSYRRFVFLTVLRHSGTVTQHELALALGYSDPAVSAMLVELSKDDYVQTAQSPEHARKRLVTLTARGEDVVARCRILLDAHFDRLLQLAEIDARQYREMTERLHQALISKMKEQEK